jgi:hypothetical protein
MQHLTYRVGGIAHHVYLPGFVGQGNLVYNNISESISIPKFKKSKLCYMRRHNIRAIMETSPNIYAGRITLGIQYNYKEIEDVPFQVTLLPTENSVVVAINPIKLRQAHYTPALCFGLYNPPEGNKTLTARNFKVYTFSKGAYNFKENFAMKDPKQPVASYAQILKIVVDEFNLNGHDSVKRLVKYCKTHKKLKEFTFSVHHSTEINSSTNADFLMTKIVPSINSRMNAN